MWVIVGFFSLAFIGRCMNAAGGLGLIIGLLGLFAIVGLPCLLKGADNAEKEKFAGDQAADTLSDYNKSKQ